jgi:hypothetical protein
MEGCASPVCRSSCAEDLQIGHTTVMKVSGLRATIIEGDRHKKEPQAEYALGVGRSLLPRLGF